MRFATVLAIGAAAIDRIATTEALQARLATSNPGRVRASPGGAARNVAEALARLAVPVRLAAVVGADGDGAAVMSATGSAGVDISGVVQREGVSTATYLAVHDGAGDIVLGVADMRAADTTPADFVTGALAGTPEAFVFADANLGPQALAALAASGRRLAASTISVDKSRRLRPLFGRLDALFLNRYEGAALSGCAPEDTQTMIAMLAGQAAPRGVLGLGAAGALVWDAGRSASFGSAAADVVSTNGAGDTLAAATLAGWRLGMDFIEAARIGMQAAALTVASPCAVSPDLSVAIFEMDSRRGDQAAVAGRHA